MNTADFAFIAQFLKDRSGLIITQDKMYLLETRLSSILRDNGLASLTALVELLRQPGATAVKDQVVDAMTTNETSFFRDNHPFDTLRKSIIPGLIERRAATRSLRIWSAACSTGQEPYSLAMMLKDSFPILGGWKVEIVATDLSPTVIEHARAATYPAAATAAVPRPLASAWIATRDGQSTIDPLCAGIVQYRQLNLMGDWPIRGTFDVIFCRNVMIYFDEPTKARLQERLVDKLVPGGHFYIGHSERLIGTAAERCRPIGQTIYRKDAA